jgi:hypothetical protein
MYTTVRLHVCSLFVRAGAPCSAVWSVSQCVLSHEPCLGCVESVTMFKMLLLMCFVLLV